jgi:hypothetical protein
LLLKFFSSMDCKSIGEANPEIAGTGVRFRHLLASNLETTYANDIR